jgi:hypothetical protein
MAILGKETLDEVQVENEEGKENSQNDSSCKSQNSFLNFNNLFKIFL